MHMLRAIARGLLDLLREIGDQNAYSRHLRQRGLAPSGEAWRHFSDERFSAKYKRAKCC